MMMIYRESDTTLDAVKSLTIAVIGYGSQGHAQSVMMKKSGLKVVVGVRKNGDSWKAAKADGFEVLDIKDAVKKADIVQILIPDQLPSANL